MVKLDKRFYPDGWVYWNRIDPDPFCPICFKENNLTTHLEKNDINYNESTWHCKIHKKDFNTMNDQNPFYNLIIGKKGSRTS